MDDEIGVTQAAAQTGGRASDDLGVGGADVPRLPAPLRATLAAERLAQTSDRDSCRRVGLIVATGVLSLVAAIAVDHPATWVAHALVGGVVLTSLIAAEHEALHGSMFSAPLANHVVGTVSGALCLTPYSAYRTYHLRHHHYTHVEQDSEPIMVIRNRPTLVALLALSTLGLAAALWARLLVSLVGGGNSFERRLRRPLLDLSSLAVGVGFLGLLVLMVSSFGLARVLLAYGAPLCVYLVLSAASFLPEHYECSYGPAPAWSTTRSTPSNRLTRFVLWNANLHTAHHLVPAVPCHSLPRLHELIESRCEHLEPGYVAYYRALWGRIGRRELPSEAPWST